MSSAPTGTRLPFLLLAPVLALATFAAACDKVPLFAPSNSTITITINRTTLPLNGSAEVTATVIESAGTSAQNGTLVTFTSNLGTFEPSQAETQGGRATVVFNAGARSGTASITASSGGVRATAVDVLVGAAAAERVVLRSEPSSVPITGGTVQLVAVVTDVSGNPLEGAQVVFSADNGTVGSSSGITNAAGEARTTLTTNRQTTARASVAGKEGTATIQAISQPLVTITGPTTAITAGAIASFSLTTPAAGTGVTINPIVSITVEFGDGNVRQVSPGTTSVTHVYNNPNTYVVTARATDASGMVGTSSTAVAVLERAGIPITLSASPLLATPTNPPNSVRAFEVITFTVNNTPNNPVNYTWNMGDGTTYTTTAGRVDHRFGSGTLHRTVSVTVRTVDGATGTATMLLRIVDP